ncbi:MAG: hypothetical protein LBP52_05475 [Burkholderiaceae bacterium]|jgi:hypothetical protein|nr:hypothetical protein [Burkholderiaceae bacterium]
MGLTKEFFRKLFIMDIKLCIANFLWSLLFLGAVAFLDMKRWEIVLEAAYVLGLIVMIIYYHARSFREEMVDSFKCAFALLFLMLTNLLLLLFLFLITLFIVAAIYGALLPGF